MSAPRFLSRLLVFCLATSVAGATARAQNISHIALDGSLPGGRTDVLIVPDEINSRPGQVFFIGEDLGFRPDIAPGVVGPNLFHSFLQFNLDTVDTATFTKDPLTPDIANLIARVTGNSPSAIDGTLRSSIPGANVFFLNPRGVMFGGSSSIDVQGSFYTSTAHRLEFEGTENYLDLLDRAAPSLEISAPEAFGFAAGEMREKVLFQSLAQNQYEVPAGQTISVVAGDIEINNSATLPGSERTDPARGRRQHSRDDPGRPHGQPARLERNRGDGRTGCSRRDGSVVGASGNGRDPSGAIHAGRSIEHHRRGRC